MPERWPKMCAGSGLAMAGWDHDSVGPCSARTRAGADPPAERLTPATATGRTDRRWYRGCDVRLPIRLRQLPNPGFPGCRGRRCRIVLVEAERVTDGSVVLRDKGLEPRARCGIVPENVVK